MLSKCQRCTNCRTWLQHFRRVRVWNTRFGHVAKPSSSIQCLARAQSTSKMMTVIYRCDVPHIFVFACPIVFTLIVQRETITRTTYTNILTYIDWVYIVYAQFVPLLSCERERECSRICVITSHLIFQTHSTAIWMCQNGWDANKWSHKLTQASPRVNTKSLVHTGKNTHTRSKDYKINGGKVDMICGLSVCIQHNQSNQMIWMVYCAFVLYYLWFDCSLCERLTDIKRLRWFKWYKNKKNCQRR